MIGLILILIVMAGIILFRTGVVYVCWATLAAAGFDVGDPTLINSLALAVVLGIVVSYFKPGGGKG
jgi:hypothetical protein